MIPCRLVGGRFDGDEGRMESPLPTLIYAAVCPALAFGLPTTCGQGGIHWYFDPPHRDAEVYRRDVLTATGVQLYVLDVSPEQIDLTTTTKELVPA